MTKICLVTQRKTGAKPEVLFSSDKSEEAIQFYRSFKGEGELCLFLHPVPERSKKLKQEPDLGELVQDAPKRGRKALL